MDRDLLDVGVCVSDCRRRRDLELRRVAVRPSGTEPKVKFYMFTYQPAELIADLGDTRDELSRRLENLQRDLAAFVESV